jgi:hypothetical protein
MVLEDFAAALPGRRAYGIGRERIGIDALAFEWLSESIRLTGVNSLKRPAVAAWCVPSERHGVRRRSGIGSLLVRLDRQVATDTGINL